MSIRLSGGRGGGERERGLTQQPGFEPSASLKYDTLLLDKQPIRIMSGCTPCQLTVMCVLVRNEGLMARFGMFSVELFASVLSENSPEFAEKTYSLDSALVRLLYP